MLSKLAFLNLKNNKGFFIAYILSIALFIAIVYQLANMEIQLGPFFDVGLGGKRGSTGELFTGIKYFFYIVVGLFAIYISRFFVKRRLKEVALLKTLGLNTKNIWFMFLIENIIIIILATIIGLIIGIIFSKFFIMLVSSMIGLTINHVDLLVNLSGLSDVFILIIGFYLIISIVPLFSISKTNISELFTSSVANDKEIKSGIPSFILFIIFTITLIYLAVFYLPSRNIVTVPEIFLYLFNACLVAIFFYRGLLVFIFNNKSSKRNRLNSIVRLLSFQHLATNIRRLYKMMALITIFAGIFVASVIFSFGYVNSVLGQNVGMNVPSHLNVVVENKASLNKIKPIIEDKIGKTFISDVYVNKNDNLLLYKKSDFLKITNLNEEQKKLVDNNQAIVHFANPFLDQENDNLIKKLKKQGLTKIEKDDQEIFYSVLGPVYSEDAFQKKFIDKSIVVLDDNNSLFKGTKTYSIISSKDVLKQTDVLRMFEVLNNDTFKTTSHSILSDNLISTALVKMLFSIIQLIVFLVVVIVTISLLMAIFFRNLENLEKGMEEYMIAKKLGMSDKQVMKANLIESVVTQIFPFLVGFVVAIPLLNQLFFTSEFIEGNVLTYLIDPSVIGIILFIFLILVILCFILVSLMVTKINKR